MRKETITQSHSSTRVISSIKDGSLSPTAMAIIIYALSAMQPGYLIAIDHLTIAAVLGIKRTSFFNAIKALKKLEIFTKCGYNMYRVEVKHILQRSVKVIP